MSSLPQDFLTRLAALSRGESSAGAAWDEFQGFLVDLISGIVRRTYGGDFRAVGYPHERMAALGSSAGDLGEVEDVLGDYFNHRLFAGPDDGVETLGEILRKADGKIGVFVRLIEQNAAAWLADRHRGYTGAPGSDVRDAILHAEYLLKKAIENTLQVRSQFCMLEIPKPHVQSATATPAKRTTRRRTAVLWTLERLRSPSASVRAPMTERALAALIEGIPIPLLEPRKVERQRNGGKPASYGIEELEPYLEAILERAGIPVSQEHLQRQVSIRLLPRPHLEQTDFLDAASDDGSEAAEEALHASERASRQSVPVDLAAVQDLAEDLFESLGEHDRRLFAGFYPDLAPRDASVSDRRDLKRLRGALAAWLAQHAPSEDEALSILRGLWLILERESEHGKYPSDDFGVDPRKEEES